VQRTTSRPARASLFRENVRMALQAILSTKLRSFLTVLGIVIGVGTVIAMTSLISGLGRSIRGQIASLGSGVLYVTKQDSGFESGSREERNRKDLRLSDAEAIATLCPSVLAVSPEIKRMTHASVAGHQTSLLTLLGATEDFARVNDWEPAVGRFLGRDDLRHRADVCVLGAGPADILFPYGDPVGQRIEVDGRVCLVIGVLEEKGKFLGRSMDDLVLLPLSVLAGRGGAVDYITVRPVTPDKADEARDEITELLRRRRGVRADQPDDFGITSQANLLELYHRLTGAFFLITLVISSIGLLVGGIGVMNMMLIAVKERTREIGVRAALGARRRDLLGQFLTETITLTFLGGVLGAVLGFALAAGVGLRFGIPMAVTPAALLLVVGLSAGVGLFSGMYPAWRASRLDPIEALRHE
jgi:putative ABC transport system permease protein